MKPTTDARPRIGARRARIHLPLATLALGVLCLTASSFAVRANAAEETLPASWTQFGGIWQGDLSANLAPSDWVPSSGAKTLPPPEVKVQMVDGTPQVLLTRYKLRVDWDGTIHFVPFRQLTSKVYVQGETMVFRIADDGICLPGDAKGAIDTEWKLELKDRGQGTLVAIGNAQLTPSPAQPLPVRRIFRDESKLAEGC